MVVELDPKQSDLLDHFGADLEPGLRKRITDIRHQAMSLLADYGQPNVHLLPIAPRMPIDLGSARSYIKSNLLRGLLVDIESSKQEHGTSALAVLVDRAKQLDPLQPFRAIAQFGADIATSEIEAEMEKSAQLAYQCLLVTPLKERVIAVGRPSDTKTLVIYSWDRNLVEKLASICNSPAGSVDARPEQFSRYRLEDCHIRFTTSEWGYRGGRDELYLDVHPRVDNITVTKTDMPHSPLRRIKQVEFMLQAGQRQINDFLGREFEYPSDLT